jgi:hypothetical protein
MIMGGVVAILLVELDPNISIYAFVVTSIAILITLGVDLLVRSDKNFYFYNSILILIIIGFAIWSGSLLSLGFLYGNKVASILVILGGVGSICFLCYRAWSTEEMQPKVGVYTVAAILTYELWLFANRVIDVWAKLRQDQ